MKPTGIKLTAKELKKYEFFSELKPSRLKEALICMQPCTDQFEYQKNEHILYNEERGGQIHLVSSGVLKSCFVNYDGTIFVNRLYPPHTLVGLTYFLIHDATSDMSDSGNILIAKQNAQVWQISVGAFQALCDRIPELMQMMIRKLLDDLEQEKFLTNMLRIPSARKRIGQYILYQSYHSQSDRISFTLSITDFSAHIGLSRPACSKILHQMENLEMIRLRPGWLEILNKQALIDYIGT